jgi:hypothetical protein
MLHLKVSPLRPAKVGPLVPLLLASLSLLFPGATPAQTAGEGSITGTVTDSFGAVVADATVTATNIATNVAEQRKTSSAGLYTIAPLPVGMYNLKVEAKGFKALEQENLDVDALNPLAYNAKLTVGAQVETVTVTTAPPALDTESAVLGVVMENEEYANLPIIMATTQQRDPTAFASLVPGAQNGSRTPVVAGIANYQGYLYLDGVPSETINQQGDNRTVSLSMSLEAVDQFQVLTSVPPAEYMGAGASNFTMKSGGKAYHGQVSDYLRNTILDAWQFTQKEATVKTVTGATVAAPKSVEHGNELSASVGGHVPHTGEKLFFFFAYDRYHSRLNNPPGLTTIPTTAMESGDFSALSDNGKNDIPIIFDPQSNTCGVSGCTRTPFSYNGKLNVIPPGRISAITNKMQSFMPNYPGSPNSGLSGNYNASAFNNDYLGTAIGGRDNHLYDWRVDYDLNARNRISSVGAMGHVVYTNNFGTPYLPVPYAIGDYATIVPKQYNIEDVYTITDHLTNQFKVGYTRFYMPITNPTQGLTQYEIGTLGVTNLPAGQAGQEFPGVSFAGAGSLAGSILPATWTTDTNSASTQLTIPNNYELVDNVGWLKGKHQFTFGISYQFEGLNNANPATYTGVLPLTFDQYATAGYGCSGSNCTIDDGSSSVIDQSKTGYAYASFLLGAVGATGSGTTGLTLPLQNVATIYSRIKAAAPYAEDTFKLNSKLTVDLGFRWDYLPPLHEKFNHFTFLNPTVTNTAVGYSGALEFDGNFGGAGVSCGCKTPVQTYWKNFGPRVGLTYALDDKTVIRAASGLVYSQGGGTGGGRVAGNGGSNGAGQALGFNTTAVAPGDTLTGAAAGPSFWLNSTNSDLFGAGYAYPAAPAPGAASTILDAGNYLNGSGAFVTPSTMGYVDPYLSGRAPMYTFWNVGIERSITKNMIVQVNYVGDEAHHTWDGSSQNSRGYWNNQLNPAYLAVLGPVNGVASNGKPTSLLTAPATSANVATLNANMAGLPNPASFIAAANKFPGQSTLSIAQMLTAFPQYNNVIDTFGGPFSENFSYNAVQFTVSQRMTQGLSFNANLTLSKNIGDDGTFRSGYAIPAAAIDGHGQSWKQDRIDRSWTTISVPTILNAYGVYQLPFGAGKIGATNFLVRQLAGGWQVSGVYSYDTGSPFTPTWSSGGNCANAAPNSGQCMPSINTAFSGPARKNGKFGSGPNGFNACNAGLNGLGQSGCVAIQYVDPSSFAKPANVSTASATSQYLIGNAPRTRAYGITGPANQTFNASVRRTFPIYHEMAFVFQADIQNVLNLMIWGAPSGGWGTTSTGYSASFGTVGAPGTLPRDFQLSGHINF